MADSAEVQTLKTEFAAKQAELEKALVQAVGKEADIPVKECGINLRTRRVSRAARAGSPRLRRNTRSAAKIERLNSGTNSPL
jgi:hypothetical protein